MDAKPTSALSLGSKASINTLLFTAAFACATMYQSEWGLAGSYWNILVGVFAALLLTFNFVPRPHFAVLCGLPLALAWLSLLLNTSSTLGLNSLRSVALTTLGLLLLGIRSVPLNPHLLRRCMAVYLAACFGLSAIRYAALPADLPNPGFSTNPDGAAQLFFIWAIVALYLFRSPLRWLVAAASLLMISTTYANGAAIAAVLVVAMYGALSGQKLASSFGSVILSGARAVLVIGGLFFLAYGAFPDSSTQLAMKVQTRLTSSGLHAARGFIWERALRISTESPGTILIGKGPARAGSGVVVGSHSAYIEAFLSYGYPYLAASLMSLAVWTGQLVRVGHVRLLALVLPMLAWGITETLMFTGLRLPWLLLILVATHMESPDDQKAPSRQVEQASLRNPLGIDSLATLGAGRHKASRPMRPHMSA